MAEKAEGTMVTVAVGRAPNGQHGIQFVYSPETEKVSLYTNGEERRQFSQVELRQVLEAGYCVLRMIDIQPPPTFPNPHG